MKTTSSRRWIREANKGLIEVKPPISGIFPHQDSVKAFQTAGDRSKSMKVLVNFD